MKIRFRLGWAKGPVSSRHFKSAPSFELFADYLKRISRFAPSEAAGLDAGTPEKEGAFWFCHTAKDAKPLSSEELARELEKLRQRGVKVWNIAIGPADGFSKEDIAAWKPEKVWNFGPMTLPHELAAAVAAEQVYRAFTILANQPYHGGH
jgi:23S rRNA (pseudouridine1915-N3)-methyltransferase